MRKFVYLENHEVTSPFVIELKSMNMKSTWNKLDKILKIGLILLVVGTGPILIVIGLDSIGIIEAGNAMGPGILAFLTFYPSIILIIIGSIRTFLKRNKTKSANL